MAVAQVESLLGNLNQLLLYKTDLIYGVFKDQVEILYNELCLMKVILKDLKTKHGDYNGFVVTDLVRLITDVAYEAQDIIDTFVVNNGVMHKEIDHSFDHADLLLPIIKDIQPIKAKMKEIYDKKLFDRYVGKSSKKSSLSQTRKLEDYVIGFDEEAKQVVSRLTNINESLEVVSVVGTGGLGKTTLAKKKDKTRDLWENVAESVGSYAARDPTQCLDVLALSYKHLPDHLKACFLYFGAFPGNFPVPVSQLVMLWVAEGFIQESEQECLEDLAEEYLEDLVERNLILIAERRANGRIKTCCVHDMLRDLCIREAREEKFLQVINRNIHDQASLISSGSHSYHRRLCVHSGVINFIHSKPLGPHVRSFLCFMLEETELSGEHASFIYEAFKIVHVLDIRSINISRFPVEIAQMVHLRYISISGDFKVLPSSISKLWSLQSLIVQTTSRDLDIQVELWKMSQFRHLITNVPSHLRGPQAQSRMDIEHPFVQGNMQTLSIISPHSCTENIFVTTPNLKKLGICGKLATSLFSNLAKLHHLEKLKLLNAASRLRSLPPSYKFPPHLNKLTLSNTLLDWKHMSTIAILPYLEVLKLKMYAFTGPRWESLNGGFRLLKYLLIGKTDLVHWEASFQHFPRLQHIVLEQCGDLVAVPCGLADVSSLQSMELRHTPCAISSARLIHQHKKKQSNGFKLLISPPPE